MDPYLFIYGIGYSLEQSIFSSEKYTGCESEGFLPNNDSWLSLWHSNGAGTEVLYPIPFI